MINYHQKAKHMRSTTLHRYNVMMQRHKERYLKGPIGANGGQWEAYRDWLDEWRKVIVEHRDVEIQRLTREQLRRDNDRKRDQHGGRPRRGA